MTESRAISVADAVERRQAVRTFRDEPIDPAVLRDILERAGRAPSNGNLQPWQVHVATGPALKAIETDVLDHMEAGRMNDGATVDVYPPGLWEPYRGRRRAAGVERYDALGFRDKDPAGLALLSRMNAGCFGAPAGLFFYLQEGMGRHQWCDLGMYMQTVMLLAVEQSLDTCPQAFWTNWDGVLRAQLGVADDMVLVAGMAIGHRDSEAPINGYRTSRAASGDWLHMHG